MGLVKRAADLAFTFRFLRMLVMKWENWDAYKLGIIDEKGKRNKEVKLDDDAKKSAYTPFIRLAANVKRLVGMNKLTSLASALYLIRESMGVSDREIEKILKETHISTVDFLAEDNQWFVLENKMLSPGVYRVKHSKVINSSFEEVVQAKDQIRVEPDTYPHGSIFGIDIYEAIHIRSKQRLYVTAGEITK
jgi:hypothetical protein